MALIMKWSAIFTTNVLMWEGERKVQGMTTGQTNRRVRKAIQ
jgi:hypothetical protein